jgi:uncharacterized protein
MTNLSDFSWYTGNLDWLARRTIFLTKHGSQAYGTALPTSDIDLKGIAIAPRAYYLGFLQHFEQAEVRTPLDVVIYDIRKFFKLAADCNPNIIEMLFTDEADWIVSSRFDSTVFPPNLWRTVHDQRDLFLSRRAQHTFSGYAIAQLKRIKTHRAWLLDPPKKQPERSDFGLKNGEGTIGKEQLGVIEAEIRKRTDTLAGKGVTKDILEQVDDNVVLSAAADLNLDINLVPLILAERRYAAASRHWASYQKWKTERNPARAELEAKHGYDTKHAMHLVRLLRMAHEILGSGKVLVKRPDAAELLDIRMGQWTFDDLMNWTVATEAGLVEVAQNSPLPKEPDRNKLDAILVEVVGAAL